MATAAEEEVITEAMAMMAAMEADTVAVTEPKAAMAVDTTRWGAAMAMGTVTVTLERTMLNSPPVMAQ